MHTGSDTLNSVVDLVGRMSEMEYVYLLFKLIGVTIGALTALLTFLAIAYKAFTFVWAHVMRHIKDSLAGSYVTPEQLKQTFQVSEQYFFEIMRRLDDGDQRMWSMENRCQNSHPTPPSSSIEPLGGAIAA